jgi:hypothetical protein
MLYQLTPEQFNAQFDIIEAHNSMSGEEWTHDAYWAGWFSGQFSPFWSSIEASDYVLVFWTVPDGAATGWSAELTVSLRTSLLPSSLGLFGSPVNP